MTIQAARNRLTGIQSQSRNEPVEGRYSAGPIGIEGRKTFKVSSDVFFQEVHGEVVLLNLRNGKYYGLDRLGSEVWQLLCEQGDLEKAIPVLLEEYEVSEERLRKDIDALLAELRAAGILEG